MEARQSLREGLDKNTHFVFLDLVDKARLVMKHVSFFVICFLLSISFHTINLS